MFKVVLSVVIASFLVAYTSGCCLVCPQAIPDDPCQKYCVQNKYGQFNVTESEFSNWNCVHPFNKYTKVSNTPCPPKSCPSTPTTPQCENNCDQEGPKICASLPNPTGLFGYTTAVFANQCQLNYYNCMNPTRQYQPNMLPVIFCVSLGW